MIRIPVITLNEFLDAARNCEFEEMFELGPGLFAVRKSEETSFGFCFSPLRWQSLYHLLSEVTRGVNYKLGYISPAMIETREVPIHEPEEALQRVREHLIAIGEVRLYDEPLQLLSTA